MFLVNTQPEQDRRRDEAWVFQPRMWVLDAGVPPHPIFVQRLDWQHDLSRMDPISREETVEGRPGDHGIAVLMRYTLRLLTLQQFQRAAALLCACETIRKADLAKWGTVPFQLGLWVGSKATPNTLKQAAESLRQGNVGGRPGGGGTPHQLTSCPWCGREILPQHVRVYEPPGGGSSV